MGSALNKVASKSEPLIMNYHSVIWQRTSPMLGSVPLYVQVKIYKSYAHMIGGCNYGFIPPIPVAPLVVHHLCKASGSIGQRCMFQFRLALVSGYRADFNYSKLYITCILDMKPAFVLVLTDLTWAQDYRFS